MSATVRVLRDLPGIAEFEARLWRIATNPSPLWCKDGDNLMPDASELSLRLFGLALYDTGFDEEAAGLDYDADPDACEAAEEVWEQHFALVAQLDDQWFRRAPSSDPEARLVWEAMGWDVTDGRGAEMRCVLFLGRQIVALAKGLRQAGAAPEREMTSDEANELEARLRNEVAKFRPKR